jgi:NADH-quinone oxidoreductase subunit H
LLAPAGTLFLSFTGWTSLPFYSHIVIADINLGILFFLGISTLTVYTIIIAGWISNSKYAFLGALRTVAQMISYEISIGLIIIPIILCTGSLNMIDIVYMQKNIWFIFPLFPLALFFFVSILAETNRAPFDLPEAEAEIVAGYNIEYSAMTFAMFFLGEYSNILLMSSIYVIFFLGGWSNGNTLESYYWFSIKILFINLLFIYIRAISPRFRYDQLMNLGWKFFLPHTLGYLFPIISILLFFNAAPFLNIIPKICYSQNFIYYNTILYNSTQNIFY